MAFSSRSNSSSQQGASSSGSSSAAGGSSLSDEAIPHVELGNLRDNPHATKQHLRVGRGDSSRRGNYCGRGMKGQKARTGSGPHLLYDGGQLSLIKFPVTRERPPYEVLYSQVGMAKVLEYIQLGLLDPTHVITMKHLCDSGCVDGDVKYGVRLYGKAFIPFPVHLQVTACDEDARRCLERGGGSVTRVYYTREGLKAALKPQLYLAKNLPLPLPAVAWHPRYDIKFDAIGQIPAPPQLPLPQPGQQAAAAAAATPVS